MGDWSYPSGKSNVKAQHQESKLSET